MDEFIANSPTAESLSAALPGTSPVVDVAAMANQALAQAQAPKRGRGRPRKNPLDNNIPPENLVGGNSGAGISSNPVAENTLPQAPVPTVDREMMVKSVAGILKIADKVICNRVRKSSLLLSAGDKDFANQVVKDVQLLDEELEIIPQLAANVIIKHQLAGQYAEEIMLGAALAGYGLRVMSVNSKLNELADTLPDNAARAPKQ